LLWQVGFHRLKCLFSIFATCGQVVAEIVGSPQPVQQGNLTLLWVQPWQWKRLRMARLQELVWPAEYAHKTTRCFHHQGPLLEQAVFDAVKERPLLMNPKKA
jgi:hypothetical protein